MGQLLARVSEAAAAVQSRLSALDQAAHRDPLTGLLNRRGFFLEADPLFHARVGGAFALIDLDRFKLINDTYGHPTGDRVIRDFCNRLRATVGRDDVVARWGGEEFAVYFPRADEAHARGVLEQLAASIRDRPIAELGNHIATFSAGLVEVTDEPVDRTIERADAALYAAKRSGRAQVLVERDVLARAMGGLG
nr:GGDEF domain-containing protein [Sphingomonas japonica]